MARLLIVTAWYYPFIHPRAHRWASLAEHWAAQGHEVHVVCARRRACPKAADLNGVEVHRVGFDSLKELFYYWMGGTKGRGRVGAGIQKPGWGMKFLSGLYATIWKKIYFPDDAGIWYFPARKKVLDLLRQNSFDALITVSLPFTGHMIGLAAKRVFPKMHWLADIGDPFTIQARPLNNSFLYGKRSRRLEKKVLGQADNLVVTHAAAARVYRQCFGSIADKIQVAPPLLHPLPTNSAAVFSPSLRASVVKKTLAERPIRIGYFGALYAPVRTPNAFIKLLEKTFEARPDLKQRLEVHFYGDVFPEFYDKLKKEKTIQLHGLQSRQTVRTAMGQMDILLNIGNTTDYQLPSKVVDYLAAGKPVLHLSYVDQDPFVDFWADAPGLFVLRVHDLPRRHEGREADNPFLSWLDFLESPPADQTEFELKNRLADYSIQTVSKVYTALIPGLQQIQSGSTDVEVPTHR